MLSIRFIALNIYSINISTFLASILFWFFNPISQKKISNHYIICILYFFFFGFKFSISLFIIFLIIFGCFSISTTFYLFYYSSCCLWI